MFRPFIMVLGFVSLVVSEAAAQNQPAPGKRLEEIIATIQREFPDAGAGVTGGQRTVQRQAELMSHQARSDAKVLAQTYTPRGETKPPPYIDDMVRWVKDHPKTSDQQATAAFEDIINRARKNGYEVSRHLGDAARDIHLPRGTAEQRQHIEARLRELGARVRQEPGAAGGPHWHISLETTTVQTPRSANTGSYSRQAQEDRRIVAGNVSRSERMNRIQKISPMQSGFGGVILGNHPVRAPRVDKAEFRFDKEQAAIHVTAGNQNAVLRGLTRTELWSAYQFLRPNKDLGTLGAERGDLGLVGIAKNNIGVDGSWDFGVHPAIANTLLARDAMGLDMVISLADPRLPRLPGGWVTYRWYDEPAVIALKDGVVVVEAANPPHDKLIRLTLWGKDKEVPADTLPFVTALYRHFEGLRNVDRFARLVAVLTWLDEAGKLPPLPGDLQPHKINQPSKCYLTDVAYPGSEVFRGQLTKEDAVDARGRFRKTHVVELEASKTYTIELQSGAFDAYLYVEDAAGKTLAEDDDSGGSRNACLVFRPRQTGLFRLVATSYAQGAAGPYWLKVWEGEPLPK
jgi:hypothetical protein